mmetsp:Transcript_4840/g.8303  ORF Transcript_4840/g.8303 Transcript_4840/m.8303 type:complete len:80 (-) Transcript_4840:75-314(-)
MVLDIHKRQMNKEMEIEHSPVTEEEIEFELEELEPNAQGRYTKAALSEWVVNYIKNHKPEITKMEGEVLHRKLTKTLSL